jgi:lysophospholipase L1-like esterase
MPHVVLLGDSIFDNRVYVAPEPDVVRQLRSRLGSDWRATLLAVDGHVTADVRERQLPQLPDDASHLVLSVGGNDALERAAVLGQAASTVGDAVAMLDRARERFRDDYRLLLDALVATDLQVAVCTVYDANYPGPEGRVVGAALSLFNDIITREAFRRALPLIDLRLICDRPEDYANPIEPSAAGGDKIAAAIAAMLDGPPATRSTIWTHGRAGDGRRR